MTSEGFESDSADTCAGKFPLVSMGGRAEGLACADPGARTPIGAGGNFQFIFLKPLDQQHLRIQHGGRGAGAHLHQGAEQAPAPQRPTRASLEDLEGPA